MVLAIIFMAIEPEVIPPTSSAGNTAVSLVPKWFFYGLVLLGVLIMVGILKTLLPLLVMGLVLGFIWRSANNN